MELIWVLDFILGKLRMIWSNLEGQGAEQIYASLLKSLHDGGFENEYLRKNLIAFSSDGASVMLGRNSGVGTRLKNDYPNIILCHCFNHRLQLI